jgi:diacylglycerol kinase
MIRFLTVRARSFVYAWRGGMTLLGTQPNARIHLVGTLVVAAAGAGWRISASEWALLAIACGLVWLAEAFNTALEFLADEVSLERRERIGRAKDVAAFGVLVAAVTAVAVGIAVFGPRILG